MEKITPSYEACKNFVCNVLPLIMQDLQKKGKLPPEYLPKKKSSEGAA